MIIKNDNSKLAKVKHTSGEQLMQLIAIYIIIAQVDLATRPITNHIDSIDQTPSPRRLLLSLTLSNLLLATIFQRSTIGFLMFVYMVISLHIPIEHIFLFGLTLIHFFSLYFPSNAISEYLDAYEKDAHLLRSASHLILETNYSHQINHFSVTKFVSSNIFIRLTI